MSQKQLNALRNFGVPPGATLNPYGQKGNTPEGRKRNWWKADDSFRAEAMKRKRIILQKKKAVALEAHELQQIARENATLCMNTLVEISKNKRAPEATRIAASAVILDRAYGKASQTSITANVSNGKTDNISAEDLDKRIGHALKRVEDLTNRAPKAGAGKKRSVDIRKYN